MRVAKQLCTFTHLQACCQGGVFSKKQSLREMVSAYACLKRQKLLAWLSHTAKKHRQAQAFPNALYQHRNTCA